MIVMMEPIAFMMSAGVPTRKILLKYLPSNLKPLKDKDTSCFLNTNAKMLMDAAAH